MKRIVILIMSVLLVCSMLSGCIGSSKPEKETEPTTAPTVATEEVSGENSPFPTPTVPIETIPKSTDDSDYQLPPGERPTVVPEVK